MIEGKMVQKLRSGSVKIFFLRGPAGFAGAGYV